MKMSESVKFKMLILLSVFMFVIFSIEDISTKRIGPNDTTLIRAHLRNVEEETHRGGTTYSVYTLEDNIEYIISVQYNDCFQNDALKREVKNGDDIVLYVKYDQSTTGKIVSLTSKGKNYYNLDALTKK